ncbi:response regulator [Desertibacillus haloalkaliphilus]|uniref:response regulator n=1 Tax=Desertibacillus haloalkaliphilus TaxID=1328930 RepID=UPI001C27BE1B|nr:response regulator [Desertibacillus haloalkaliphilus]MBU8907762.1 response regulator [Desertibacillus haloalkaliphilus]
MNQNGTDEITVLLIEDDPMVQEVNRLFIEKVDGFSVIGVASNGKEGRQQVHSLKPDLVLLDIYMPDTNGMMLVQQLRQEDTDVDIIAVTAANDTKTVKTLMRYGAIDYIVKPFTFERLEKALKQYKDVYLQLNEQAEVSQDQLDEVLQQKDGKVEQGLPEELPKGLHVLTLKQIYTYLEQTSEPKSAEAIGASIGMARVTVRRYLNYLESIGKVEMELTYGTIGRPIQMYQIKTTKE